MLLSEYLHNISRTLEEFTKTGMITFSSLTVDFRTTRIGMIKGVVDFPDDSKLFFKEYVDLRDKLKKETYAFHYQDKANCTIFRYDNADHKPALGFKDHKHIGNQVAQSEIPDLFEVLEEVVNNYLSYYNR